MKSYQLSPTQIQTLVPHMGSCIASDMITVQGLKVAYMYREEAQSSEESGWVFYRVKKEMTILKTLKI